MMPQNGYWIECTPVSPEQNNDAVDLYEAMICSIPEAKATADTPDNAIQELRNKLTDLRHDYCMRGKKLPEHDSPISPPRHNTPYKGWISIYIKMTDCCQAKPSISE
jgi:hypothetical protein